MSVLVKSLRDFNEPHAGEKIVVCGCGQSLLSFLPYHEKYVTIGVNDVPSLFVPTYTLVTDSPLRFSEKRRSIVSGTRSRHLFACTKGWRHPNLVHYELGTKELSCLGKSNHLDHYLNSPYTAVCLAYRLGARHIGLVGVDFTDGHFYNSQDGPHNLVKSKQLKRVNTAYLKLRSELEKRGVSLNNLSSISNLDLPKISMSEFEQL